MNVYEILKMLFSIEMGYGVGREEKGGNHKNKV
jgi:hypothetical protein